MTKDEVSVVIELQRQGLGYRRIATLTNISPNTIKSYCKRHPIDITEPVATADAYCQQCGHPVERIPHRKPKRFCSDKCRMVWWNNHRDLVKKKAYHTMTCETCGLVFQVYGKSERRYCSRACSAVTRRKVVQE